MAHFPTGSKIALAGFPIDDGGPVQAATDSKPGPQDPLIMRINGDAVKQSEILLIGLLGCTFPHYTWLSQ